MYYVNWSTPSVYFDCKVSVVGTCSAPHIKHTWLHGHGLQYWVMPYFSTIALLNVWNLEGKADGCAQQASIESAVMTLSRATFASNVYSH